MTTLTLDQAAAKYGVEKKKIVGRVLRNDFEDALWVDNDENGQPILADDWRLEKLARLANSAGDSRE